MSGLVGEVKVADVNVNLNMHSVEVMPLFRTLPHTYSVCL